MTKKVYSQLQLIRLKTEKNLLCAGGSLAHIDAGICTIGIGINPVVCNAGTTAGPGQGQAATCTNGTHAANKGGKACQAGETASGNNNQCFGGGSQGDTNGCVAGIGPLG